MNVEDEEVCGIGEDGTMDSCSMTARRPRWGGALPLAGGVMRVVKACLRAWEAEMPDCILGSSS